MISFVTDGFCYHIVKPGSGCTSEQEAEAVQNIEDGGLVHNRASSSCEQNELPSPRMFQLNFLSFVNHHQCH